MKFTDYLFEASKDIWQGYLKHPFIAEIGEGTLPKDKFKDYLVQDYLYLKEFAKVFSMGVVKAETMDEMRFFYNAIKGTMENETAIHLQYMEKLGVPVKNAENLEYHLVTNSYTSYMQAISLTGSLNEIAMCTLPCTWSYYYIGKHLKEQYNDKLENNYYKEWIEMYCDEEFYKFTIEWIEYVDIACENISEKEKNKLTEIFVKASLYEMEFWHMAYKTI
jgi:thiaminase/transcriptional activator TenA